GDPGEEIVDPVRILPSSRVATSTLVFVLDLEVHLGHHAGPEVVLMAGAGTRSEEGFVIELPRLPTGVATGRTD
ncbi:MAG: hypothetical protein ACR2QK_05915, partial [Acidimicrobiales bacterium]